MQACAGCIVEGMSLQVVFGVAAVLALVPGAVAAWRLPPVALRAEPGESRRPGPSEWLFLALAILAAAGPVLWTVAQAWQGWHAGLGFALWVSIAATAVAYLVLWWARAAARGLAPLLLSYLALLGAVAVATGGAGDNGGAGTPLGGWLVVHIILAIAAYAALTVGAVAGLAVLMRERALRTKRPDGLAALLPSVMDSERMQLAMMQVAAVLLALAFPAGMAAEYLASGGLLGLSHKTVFALATLTALVGLLAAHHALGVRGRSAARLALAAYLLLTLAYPGVKFATSIILGR